MAPSYQMFPRASTKLLIATATAAVAVTAAACSSSNFDFAPTSTSDAPAQATTPDTTATTTATTDAATATATTAASPPTAPPAQTAGAGPCHARIEYGYVLPDPACTPGATNPQVTQADIATTICASGWTKTVRPPESYTQALKHSQMSEYGETQSIHSYEEDHLIALELGGAPSDPHNLWPEPGSSPNPKDDVENAANHAVCDNTMSLAAAQGQIATDWDALGRALGVLTAPGSQSP